MLPSRIPPLCLLSLVSYFCLGTESAKSSDAEAGWKYTTERDGVTIYSRRHAGSSLKEFRAIGEINAPPRAVCEVIEDVDAIHGRVQIGQTR